MSKEKLVAFRGELLGRYLLGCLPRCWAKQSREDTDEGER